MAVSSILVHVLEPKALTTSAATSSLLITPGRCMLLLYS